MNVAKPTVGQAIDQILAALQALDKREQQVVLSTIGTLLDLAPRSAGVAPAEGVTSGAPSKDKVSTDPSDLVVPPPKQRSSLEGIDIRSLKEQKQPTSAKQMACLVAFYLQELAPEADRQTEIATADVEKYFKQAGFKLPMKMDQLLPDTKIAGYLETVSRGKYRLTRVGYNLVTHSMPKNKAAT